MAWLLLALGLSLTCNVITQVMCSSWKRTSKQWEDTAKTYIRLYEGRKR